MILPSQRRGPKFPRLHLYSREAPPLSQLDRLWYCTETCLRCTQLTRAAIEFSRTASPLLPRSPCAAFGVASMIRSDGTIKCCTACNKCSCSRVFCSAGTPFSGKSRDRLLHALSRSRTLREAVGKTAVRWRIHTKVRHRRCISQSEEQSLPLSCCQIQSDGEVYRTQGTCRRSKDMAWQKPPRVLHMGRLPCENGYGASFAASVVALSWCRPSHSPS